MAQDDSNDRNVAAIAAAMVCVGLAGVASLIFVLVQKKKRKRSGKSRRGEGDTQGSLEQSPEAAAAEEGAVGDSDVFMDEWTQKITSIPLRLAGKTPKPKSQSRPATRQSRKVWLFCKYRTASYSIS
jgi:hypothetical protein